MTVLNKVSKVWRFSALAFLFVVTLCWSYSDAVASELPDRLICCGQDEVFLLDWSVDLGPAIKWSWRASDSPAIPSEVHKWFRSTDECKPVGDSLLITSSSGGVALIRRADKRCLFLTYARNAHSACQLPDGRVVVAASTGGDQLLLYAAPSSPKQAKPLTQIPLAGAHGAVWDDARKRVWALGNERLLLVRVDDSADAPTLEVEEEWKLPTFGGHDLSQLNDDRYLFVTTNSNVYRFDKSKQTFTADAAIGDRKKVKSVTQHPKTGEIVYHMGTPKNWWSDTIRFVGDRRNIVLADRRLYKVRWDVSAAPRTKQGDKNTSHD